MRLEASRSGHGDVLPAHLLLSLLDQPEMHQALRAIRQLPDVYAMRARVAVAALAPAEFAETLPLGGATESVLAEITSHHEAEDFSVLYLLALKQVLQNHACRRLLEQGGADLAVLEMALSRID